MEDHKKVLSIQIIIEVVKLEFEVDMEVCMVDIINMNVNLIEVDEETLEKEETMEVVVEVIKVNNQITTQTSTVVGNIGTWQIIIIKGIWLLQRQYALNKLSEYGMKGCKPISIPLEQNVKLSVDEGNLVEDTTMYRCIVGSLIHLIITRLDFSYAIEW
jgi:hypothetical protein